MDFKALMKRERDRVDVALSNALDTLISRAPDTLGPSLRHGVMSKGKRLRPILCVSGYRAAGGTDDAIYALAVSLEFIHAYSLMHDDLPCMDNAELRRGEPTTHKLHGVDAATVAGAFLIPGAALQAWEAGIRLGLDSSDCRAIVTELTRAAGGGGMVGGQLLDLLGEEKHLSAKELDDLHRRKTGALLRGSLRMGGLAAKADAGLLAALEGYGNAIGLAFQIADDLLDATSDAEVLGKNPSDELLGKSTYVTLFGVDEARRRAHELVDEAVCVLGDGGIDAPELEALARFIVQRKS